MLKADNVSCVRGERRLITALSFTLERGRLLAVTGANGSGKTSLLRMLCGLLPAEQGRFLWDGEDVRVCRERYLASLIYIGHLNSHWRACGSHSGYSGFWTNRSQRWMRRRPVC